MCGATNQGIYSWSGNIVNAHVAGAYGIRGNTLKQSAMSISQASSSRLTWLFRLT